MAPELATRVERLRMALDLLGEAAESPGDHPDPVLALAVERAFQVAVEALVDMAASLLAHHGWERPDTSSQAFAVLAGRKVLQEREAEELARWVGFRNLLVHEYAKIDRDRVREILTEELDDLRRLAATMLEAVEPLLD